MNVVFHRSAMAELNDAIDYYDQKRAGLGDEFFHEVQRGIENITAIPEG